MPGGDGTGPQGKGPRTGRGQRGTDQGERRGAGQGRRAGGTEEKVSKSTPGKERAPSPKTQDNSASD